MTIAGFSSNNSYGSITTYVVVLPLVSWDGMGVTIVVNCVIRDQLRDRVTSRGIMSPIPVWLIFPLRFRVPRKTCL